MPSSGVAPTVLCFATKGSGSNEEARIIELLGELDPAVYPFDRGGKAKNVGRLLARVRRERPDLVVQEGTGLAGGIALLLAKLFFGVPYVVSSGDAVGPFLGGQRRALAVPAWLYELLLYRGAAGFIGWTPYLAGRALTMGTPRVATAAHFAADPEILLSREEVRRRLGVPDGVILAGIVGSLSWNQRYGYCYGFELVDAMLRVTRDDVAVAVVSGGTGLERVRAHAGDDLGRRVFVPGPVSPELVTSYLAAMDMGSLPQSVDQAGAFRYTTKLPEYVQASLPVITGQIPAAYDLMEDWSWRLPGDAPWSEEYVAALADLLSTVTLEEIAARRDGIPDMPPTFDRAAQRRRVAAFTRDVVARAQR